MKKETLDEIQKFIDIERAKLDQEEVRQSPVKEWRPKEGKGNLSPFNSWTHRTDYNKFVWDLSAERGLTYENEDEAKEWQKLIDWTTRLFALARWCNAKHEPNGKFYAIFHSEGGWEYADSDIPSDTTFIFTSEAAVENATAIMDADPEYWKLPPIESII